MQRHDVCVFDHHMVRSYFVVFGTLLVGEVGVSDNGSIAPQIEHFQKAMVVGTAKFLVQIIGHCSSVKSIKEHGSNFGLIYADLGVYVDATAVKKRVTEFSNLDIGQGDTSVDISVSVGSVLTHRA